MSVVAVLGAGALGGAITHKLAGRGRWAAVRLIDPARGIAAGKALDIQQAAAIERFATRLTAHDDVDAATGADVVVLADPAAGDTANPEAAAEAALATLRRLRQFNQRAVIVCAGAGHRNVVAHAAAALGIPRRQIVGTAPAALESALRAIVAVELRCPPGEVALALLGRPPERPVVAWSQATIRGLALQRIVDAPVLARLQGRLPPLWPPGPYALAAVAARVCETIAGSSGRRGWTCYAVLDGELGVRGVAAAVTTELGAGGIARIVEPALNVQERVLLDTALASRI